MNITPQEARDSLAQIEDALTQTRNAIGQGASGGILIVWGAIWALGFSADQFAPKMAQSIWPFLILGGALASWICGARSRSRIQSSIAARIGIFWLVLFAYAALWFFLLHAESRPSSSARTTRPRSSNSALFLPPSPCSLMWWADYGWAGSSSGWERASRC
jgi:hypothetical protein